MRYLVKETSSGVVNASLDIASCLLLGEIDSDSAIGSTASYLTLDTEIIPSNSSLIRIINTTTDFDKNVFIKSADKFDKGNLLVSLVPHATLGTGSSLTDFRKICYDVSVSLVSFQQSASTSLTNYTLVYGFLKETQTLDYNPADEINPLLLNDFTMLNPNDLGLS